MTDLHVWRARVRLWRQRKRLIARWRPRGSMSPGDSSTRAPVGWERTPGRGPASQSDCRTLVESAACLPCVKWWVSKRLNSSYFYEDSYSQRFKPLNCTRFIYSLGKCNFLFQNISFIMWFYSVTLQNPILWVSPASFINVVLLLIV